MEESRYDASSVYHDTDEDVIGTHPRRFVLIDDYDDEDGSPHRELALYGLAFADGGCATLRLNGMPHGKWAGPEHVACRLGLDLIWLDSTA